MNSDIDVDKISVHFSLIQVRLDTRNRDRHI